MFLSIPFLKFFSNLPPGKTVGLHLFFYSRTTERYLFSVFAGR